MNKTTRSLLAAAAALALLLPSAPAHGADALAICAPGVPFAYPNGGANVLWNPDQGALGPLTNAQGVAVVDASFDNWENLGTASITYLQGPALAVDIDITNFLPIYAPTAPNGESEIVFDANGEIFDFLFGPGSGILGFAGPDFGDFTTCELLEGSAFLNGPTFTNLTVAEDIVTHEFGHFSNLGHVELNGQLTSIITNNGQEGDDDSGPSPNNTTFGTPVLSGTEVVETMFPFYFGPTVGTRTPHADDVASMSTIYPDASFATTTGSISGAVLAPNGTTRISGVNVIARNINDPFVDAVSTFSGAYTDDTDQADPNVGIFTLSNLTPGEQYAVFIDEVSAVAPRFSNPILQPLLGPEEFWNGADESSDFAIDDPQDFVLITATAGGNASGTDIIFNQPGEGEPLDVGDDGTVQIFLPFTFCIAGQGFDAVNINANGNLTFGAADGAFSESVGAFLDGPPRIAGLWDDLNPTAGGTVSFSTTSNSFTVSYDAVPEFFATGANTFDITLKDNSAKCAGHVDDDDSDSDSDSDSDRFSRDVTIAYGDVSATDGLAGVSAGLFATNGVEPEVDLTSFGDRKIKLRDEAAVYEIFTFGETNDLGNTTQKYAVGAPFKDDFETNDTLGTAERIIAPFNTVDTRDAYSSIDPQAADVDYYRLNGLRAGTTIIAEVLRGQIDSVIGLFQITGGGGGDSDSDSDSDSDTGATGVLIAGNDDSGGTLLSSLTFTLPADGDYAIAVTFCCDFDFDGVDPGQGLPFDRGRYVLSIDVVDGIPVPLGDDDAVQLLFGFDFPFQGTTYNDIFLNSNGNLTFGTADTFFFPFVSDFLNLNPRISPLWEDLNPSAGGLVVVKFGDDCVKVSFNDVPEFPAIGSNTFSATFDATGNIQFDYGALSETGGLVGITEGGGAADPGESDVGGGAFSNAGTTYEFFSDLGDNDLSDSTVSFGGASSCGDDGGGEDDDSDSDSD